MTPIERVKRTLREIPEELQVIEFEVSTHTSELAAQALGVEVGQIAKSLLFMCGDIPVLVVTSGDVKVDQKKLKAIVGGKVRFAPQEVVEEITGFPPGGVCPVALKTPVKIFIDSSLQRFPIVYAAAGSPASALPVTVEQLLSITGGELQELA
ncbi:MAG TPA: YbaK/EbsC family protein [Candidatus Deferrimicrobium sp.]|nr:YbaK/EbsC family protein [Candidatus Deferrimicrobium sp.]